MSIISAGTTSTTALVQTGDTTGSLVLQTGATPTTAMTINSSQIVNFANAPTVAGAALPSGAMTLINTQTASNSSSIQWSSLSGYDKYIVIVENFKNNSGSTDLLQLQVGNSSGIITSGYYYNEYGAYYNGSSTVNQYYCGVNSSFIYVIAYGAIGTSNALYNAQITFTNCNTSNQAIYLNSVATNTTSNLYSGLTSLSGVTNSSALTQIKLYFSSSNIASGTASLYGISS
jgi:hypothetical protein